MPASHFAVKPMTGRPKFIVRHSTIAGKKVGHHQISVSSSFIVIFLTLFQLTV
jgi:hypothetical protein